MSTKKIIAIKTMLLLWALNKKKGIKSFQNNVLSLYPLKTYKSREFLMFPWSTGAQPEGESGTVG